MADDVLELTDQNFKDEVLESEIPTMVDFWAVWCGPCRQVSPLVEELATEYKGKLKCGKLNVDHHQQIAQKYGIRSIPTLLIFKNGQVVGQVIGAVPRTKLEGEIQKHIS